MALRNPPSWQQNASHPAENDRLTTQALYSTTGIIGSGSLAVTANSPAAMNVLVAAGWAAIVGNSTTNMGAYVIYNDGSTTVTVTAADPTLGRIDRLVATIRDSAYSGVNNDVIFQVVAGTPAASPVAPSTPSNSISLATISVAAAATTITSGNITDTRVSTTIQVPIGDITEITAGTGISVSSGTGPIPTVTNSMATTIDAKGDLVVGTGADAFARVIVGTNGTRLTADSAQTAGVAWVADTQNTVVDAKGDLLVGTAADTIARLAVSTSAGDNLVVDSTTSTGLRWNTDWNTGKNKIINSDFSINQRAFTSTTTTGTYGFDRWLLTAVDGTTTYSTQTFTLGAAPAAPYEASNFARLVTTGQTLATAVSILEQRIESVRTLANQSVTVSFWAKANTGTPKVAVELAQNFGTGGSPSSEVQTYGGQVTLSTSWARYSVTITNPSITGKTLGTGANDYLGLRLFVSAGSNFNARTGTLGIQTNTFDIWGVQVESGSVATAYTLATSDLATELAAAQRFYFRLRNLAAADAIVGGYNLFTLTARYVVPFPVEMRAKPTALEQSGTASDYAIFHGSGTTTTCSAVPVFVTATRLQGAITGTVSSGLTQFGPSIFVANATAAYLGWSAEL